VVEGPDRRPDGLLEELVGPVVRVEGGDAALDPLYPVAVEVVLVRPGGAGDPRAREEPGQAVVAEGLGARAGVAGDAGQAAAVGRDVAGAVEGLGEGARRAEADRDRPLGGVVREGLGDAPREALGREQAVEAVRPGDGAVATLLSFAIEAKLEPKFEVGLREKGHLVRTQNWASVAVSRPPDAADGYLDTSKCA
jgi:hypothetical protein